MPSGSNFPAGAVGSPVSGMVPGVVFGGSAPAGATTRPAITRPATRPRASVVLNIDKPLFLCCDGEAPATEGVVAGASVRKRPQGATSASTQSFQPVVLV